MKAEQLLTIVYSVIGILAGYLSNVLGNSVSAVSASVVIYSVSFIVLMKFLKHRKVGWILTNTLITFILVWLVVWITLYNIAR